MNLQVFVYFVTFLCYEIKATVPHWSTQHKLALTFHCFPGAAKKQKSIQYLQLTKNPPKLAKRNRGLIVTMCINVCEFSHGVDVLNSSSIFRGYGYGK